MNDFLFHAINHIRASWLDAFLNVVTSSANYLHVLAIFPLLLIVQAARRGTHSFRTDEEFQRMLIALMVGYVVTVLIVACLKYGLQEPRPGIQFGPQVVHSLEKADSQYSFPSGHSAFAMLVAAVLWPWVQRPVRCALAAYVLIIGFSRVNLGMHFPGDVLAGYIAGGLAAWLGWQASTRLRGQTNPYRYLQR